MATSVKLGEDAKDKLEQLQAELRLEREAKVSQQELLDRIVSREFESKEALFDSFENDFEGLSDEEIEAFLSNTFDSGVETTEDDVDRILYEEEAYNE
jgi:hypothetical protein